MTHHTLPVHVVETLSRDPDGEISMDWSTKAGDMLSISVSTGGRLTFAWMLAFGPIGHGEAAVPPEVFAVLDRVLNDLADAFVKTTGAYAGSRWRILDRFPHAGAERVVAESTAIPGLLHIFDPKQLAPHPAAPKEPT